MIYAYLNYPNPHLTLHNNEACADIGKMKKPNQRFVGVTRQSFAVEIANVEKMKFGASASENDLWISADFHDAAFEKAVVEYIHRFISQKIRKIE